MSKNITVPHPISRAGSLAILSSIPCSSSNYTSCSSRNVAYIVMHYTGNDKDTAKANCRYFQGDSRQASAHYFVDETSIYQSVGANDRAWAVGGTSSYKHPQCRNNNSISIEMCCSGDYEVSTVTEKNAALLCAELCRYLGIGDEQVDTNVLRHWDVWEKSCPAGWTGSNNPRWIGFKNKVKGLLNGKESEDELMSKEYDELKKKNEAQDEIINKMGDEIKELKDAASPMIYDYVDKNMPAWAKPTVEKLLNRDILRGDEQGRLGLTDEMLRMFVTNDRAGLYDRT